MCNLAVISNYGPRTLKEIIIVSDGKVLKKLLVECVNIIDSVKMIAP